MRSWREETKFHQMWRGPSMAAPPTTTKWASLAARIATGSPGLSTNSRSGPSAVAADLDLAAEHVDGALFVGGVERQRRAGVELGVGEQRVRRGDDRRALAVGSVPATTRSVWPSSLERGDVGGGGVGEGRRVSSSLIGSATHSWMPWSGSPPSRWSAAVRSECTMPRPAVIQFTAPGRIGMRGAEAVAMHDLAVEQVGDGGEPDVRVRPHVDAVAGLEHRSAQVIEEDERPDHARRPDGSARRTGKPPRSTERGTITCSMASLECASPRLGSLPGKSS